MYPKILVPIDGGPASHAALERALALAAGWGSTLMLVHAFDSACPRPDACAVEADEAQVEDWKVGSERVLPDALQRARARGVVALGVLRDARHPVAQTIAQEARTWGADLVVLGHVPARVSSGLERPAADIVRATSPTPVLLVPSASNP